MTSQKAHALAKFSTELTFDQIPDEVIHKSKQLVLDTLGIAIGSSIMPFGSGVIQLVNSWGGASVASIVGSKQMTTAQSAAFCNGVLAHGQDYDDTHTASVVHPTAALLPAALAVGEEVNASGRDVLTALVAGTEAAIAIALPVPNRFHQRGFHTTSVTSTFASTLIASKLKKFDGARTVQALGICGSFVSGLIECVPAGADAKRLHAGWPAMAGIIASQLAGIDYSGPASIFEGKLGLYNSMLRGEEIDLDELFSTLGQDWLLSDVRPKIYPCCHYLQAFIDCAASLRKEILPDLSRIESVMCRVPQGAVNIVCEPWARKLDPTTAYEARFSLPYSVALMLTKGRAGSPEFSEACLFDSEIRALMPKIRYEVDPGREVKDMPGWVCITMADGTQYVADVPVVRGDRHSPIEQSEIEAKFLENVSHLEAASAHGLMSTVMSLDLQEDLKGLTSKFSTGMPSRNFHT